ncbi:BrnT family toxin [Neorhizobium sp. Rsf11]|uniref:BrnT family toxin n=1 Tax=Neorhizobium phenanthreniclasticum TaxID=3157917 RepID=A0ABV0LW11_9HYPH
MKIVWDEPKRIANVEKHGLDFEDIAYFHWETAVMERSHSGRTKAIGYFEDGTAVVIFVRLGTEAISIISFRPANPKEKRLLTWQ